MNSVSWFMYLAGMLGKLEVLCGAALIFGGMGLVFIWGFTFAEDQPKTTAVAASSVYALIALIAVAIPSKTTMYAIAASQIGETVVASPEAREIIDDSKQILRDYLKSLKKESASK